jgi:hypothetical protein
MKYLFLIFGFVAFAQNPTNTPNGIRVGNSIEVTEVTDSTMIALFDSEKVLKYYSYKHLFISDEEREWIQSQMYENYSATISVSPTSAERGVNTSITVGYNISSNDDVITSASINQSIGSVIDDVDEGLTSISGGTKSQNTTYTLSIGYTRNGVSGSGNHSATFTTYIPKWYGASETLEDVTANDYSELSELSKVVSSANTMNFTHNTTDDEYVWFVSSVNTNKITASGFDTTIGDWNDSTAFFWKKAVSSFKLANGTDTTTVYVYRTRLMQNTSGVDIVYAFNP